MIGTIQRLCEAIEHDWGWWERRNQQAPKGDWRTWLLLAGRGFGKTRSGAECIRDQVIHHGRRRIGAVWPLVWGRLAQYREGLGSYWRGLAWPCF